MKQPILGDGWKFRDKEPENQEEILDIFLNEVKLFRKWEKTVSANRKKSIFWECDYEDQLYIDIILELLFQSFLDLNKLSIEVIDELIYIISRNHEQGNYIAWKSDDNKISYNGMTENQFRFIAKEIENRSKVELEIKFQIAIAYRKIKSATNEDFQILNKLALDKNEYIRKQSLISLNKIKNEV